MNQKPSTNESMAALEEQIQAWRQQMLAAGIKAPVPLDELESHLREDIERQTLSGVGAQQAFEAAVQKVGASGMLNTEFKKIHAQRWGRNRKIPGTISKIVCVSLAGLILWLSALVFFRSGMNLGQQILAHAAVILILLAAYCWRFALRFLPPAPRITWVRLTTGFGLQALGWCSFGAFLNFIEPRLMESSQALGILAMVWAVVPFAMVLSVGTGFMMNQREREELFEMNKPTRKEPAPAGS
jgi:hypothetical protein